MIKCTKCHGEFGKDALPGRMVSISGSIQGDECIETYFFCEQCGVYTLEVYFDFFSGGEKATVYGPIPKHEGDKKVELIKQCIEPWDKNCRCDAHLKYFEGSLD